MKKSGILFLILVGSFVTAQAQVDSVAKKVGNKTAETTVKGKSALVDEVYKNKIGPADQSPIFIDHSSKYYYVDEKGEKGIRFKGIVKRQAQSLELIYPTRFKSILRKKGALHFYTCVVLVDVFIYIHKVQLRGYAT